MSDLERWRLDFPWIDWSEPITVATVGSEGRLACRVCIAELGLKAGELDGRLFDDREQFDEHMKAHRDDS